MTVAGEGGAIPQWAPHTKATRKVRRVHPGHAERLAAALRGLGGLSEGDRDRILSGRARKRRDHQKVSAFYYDERGA
jgi:hypothetical protein